MPAGNEGFGMTSLREARLGALLSIRQLARSAGVSPTTIYLLERGQHSPQLLTIYKLSRALGVEPAVIDEFRSAIEGHRKTAQLDEKERS
jgi:transcriptional regulator with XRE-family HTH domain